MRRLSHRVILVNRWELFYGYIESAIIRQSTGELIASNWTTIILVDRTTRKSIVLTPSVKKAIQELEQNDSLL